MLAVMSEDVVSEWYVYDGYVNMFGVVEMNLCDLPFYILCVNVG